MSTLPTDAAERKVVPLAEGLLFYFPNALAEVARVSKRGNDQHNPGEPMHWAMEKSTDHADCILRHLVDAGTLDTDGMRHTAKVAWRALALLETELLAAGAMPGRNAARVPPPPEYAPDSAAFRRFWQGCGVPKPGRSAPSLGSAHPMAAEALRDQDDTTPSRAVPEADDNAHGVFDVDLTRTAFFYTTDGVYHSYSASWRLP